MATDETFADVLTANQAYASTFQLAGLQGTAGKGLTVLTCMDTRIDPLGMLGLAPGDAKILRNAGGRVNADVLSTLVLAEHLLKVDRVMVIEHTGCAMARGGEERVHEAVAAAGGPDIRSLSFLTTGDQEASVRADVQRIRSWPYLGNLSVGGFIYDIETGLLRTVC